MTNDVNMRMPKKRTPKITATELAEQKGVTTAAVRLAIAAGRLAAEKKGKTWLISPTDAAKWTPRRKNRE